MKVSIYRVEKRRAGAGPYNKSNQEVLGKMFAEHGTGSHPNPEQDELLRGIRADEYCGFATLEQLDDWFTGYHSILAENDFIVARYVVPITKVRYGKTQAVFRRGDLFPEETMPMR